MIQRPSRRQVLRQATQLSSSLAAAGSLALLAPRRARAQSSLDKLPVWLSVGSVEFLWAVLKGRKIDAKHGLDVQVSVFDANAVNQALMIGQVQVGSSQPVTAAISENAGKPVTIFAPSIWNNTAGIVAASSPVTSLKDLVGKRVATLPPLSGLYTSTQVLAAELGLNFEKDFKVTTGPAPALMAFLQRGDVDAIMQLEPLASAMLLSGKYKSFFEPNAAWKQATGEDMLFGAIGANPTWLDANRDIAKRLTAAIVESGQTIKADPSVFDEFGVAIDLKTPEAIAFAKKRLPAFYPAEWNTASAANGNHVVDRAVALGLVKKPAREIVVAL